MACRPEYSQRTSEVAGSRTPRRYDQQQRRQSRESPSIPHSAILLYLLPRIQCFVRVKKHMMPGEYDADHRSECRLGGTKGTYHLDRFSCSKYSGSRRHLRDPGCLARPPALRLRATYGLECVVRKLLRRYPLLLAT